MCIRDSVITSISNARDVTPATTVSGPSTCERQGPAKASAASSPANPMIVRIRAAIGWGRFHQGTSCARNVDTATAPLATASTCVAAKTR